MRQCSKCNQWLEESNFDSDKRWGCLLRQCKPCLLKKQREYRRANPEIRREQEKRARTSRYIMEKKRMLRPKKQMIHKVQQKLNHMILDGKIKKRNTCEFCHRSPTHCHHEDYTKPLEFIELCIQCHNKLHYLYPNKIHYGIN